MNDGPLTLDDMVATARKWLDVWDEGDSVWSALPDELRERTFDRTPEFDVAIRDVVPVVANMNPAVRKYARDLLCSTIDGIERVTTAAAVWADRIDLYAPGGSATEPRDPEVARLREDVEEIRRAIAGAASVLALVSRVTPDDERE